MRRLTCLSVIFCLAAANLSADTLKQTEPTNDHQLRSAFLGDQAWPKTELTDQQIKRSLQHHFATVLQILERQTEASLDEATKQLKQKIGIRSPKQLDAIRRGLAIRRAFQIQSLRNYATRGLFPRNEGHAPFAVPIFVDNHGTHCAVAYLMHCSGNDQVVEQIVNSNNLVYVDNIQEGRALNWILHSGLTQAEAALIQPAYMPPTFDATLTDFQTPGFSVSHNGFTVSELSVLRHSFQAPTTNLNDLFELGSIFVAGQGKAFPQPDNFGIALGHGPFDPYGGGEFQYEPIYDDWVFLGGASMPLSVADPGDDTVMYKIDYQIDINDLVFANAAIVSNANFNGNFLFTKTAALRITTELRDSKMELLGQGTIETDPGDFFFADSAFLTARGTQMHVTSFVMDYQPMPDGQSGFTSFWNEFEVVLLGDVNCDGAINLLDVQPFIDAVTNDFPDVKADINMDGSDDLLDVAGFVQLIISGG